MDEKFFLGIDAGGTHTDAALLAGAGRTIRLIATAKVKTCHEDLPFSVREALTALGSAVGSDSAALFGRISSVTLGTTLAVNALVQNRADAVGLALSAGPGLDPRRFALGAHVCVAPGGLDHRGVEVSPLRLEKLAARALVWRGEGIPATACVGKFSPRNPAHERAMAAAVATAGLPVTQGCRLAGSLNFPRRIATAYYNAAVERLHHKFLNAVEPALANAGICAKSMLLKADGGAVPIFLSRRCPVQSILSGPAGSVMGVLAMSPSAGQGCSLVLDIGGTTTDIALVLDGSPVIDRDGMLLNGRRTLVRSLATASVGVGGDSLITADETTDDAVVRVGPLREGPAMAFGGNRPTLLDALNARNSGTDAAAGDAAASRAGIAVLAEACGLSPADLARQAVDNALTQVRKAAQNLLDGVNARPIYTLTALRALHEAQPARILLVGGPATCLRERLSAVFGLPVEIPVHADVANAIGAALTLPTAALEIYADTGQGLLRTPIFDLEEAIGKTYTPTAARERACALLTAHLAAEGITDATVEVLEEDMFATLDDRGYGAKDIRVVCQTVPGIAGRLAAGLP
ncbi:hydantoinase [Deltaproteobacteria bacterium]|nr:hydantoinase [Deltaproteobacteria bacterium]